jgi:hypothetical protein
MKLPTIGLTIVLLIGFFTIYTYLDRTGLYENIGKITDSINLAAYFFPPLVLCKSFRKGNSLAKTLVEILLPSLISIPVFIVLVCVFNLLTVPNFLDNIPLYQFILLTFMTQLAYAITAALVATIVLKVFIQRYMTNRMSRIVLIMITTAGLCSGSHGNMRSNNHINILKSFTI